MSVNSVQQYAKGVIDNLSLSMFRTPLAVYITPPNPGKLPGPAAYIWITNGESMRQTAPRGLGFRKITWTVSIWLMSPGVSTDRNADIAFASLIDAVVSAYTTTPMPVSVTDSVTSATSQIIAVGERITIDQAPVRTLSDQRLFLYEALLHITVEEATQH